MFSIVWTDSGGTDQMITLDAATTESYSRDVDVTEHPVEQGANVSDHVRPKAGTLTVSGILTDIERLSFNTPQNLVVKGRTVAQVGQSTYHKSRSGRAIANFKQLEALRDGGTLVNVDTPARLHKDMLIQSLGWTRDKSAITRGPPLLIKTGYGDRKAGDDINGCGALRVTLTLRQVRLVSSQTVKAAEKPKLAKAAKKDDKGPQDAPKASVAEERKSFLKSAVEAGKKLLASQSKPEVQ